MMKHMLKIMKKRMRGNLLLLVELMISFLVVFGAGMTLFNFYDKFQQPLGFEYEGVSRIAYLQSFNDQMGAEVRRAADVLRQQPEVEDVEVLMLSGFSSNLWGARFRLGEAMDSPSHWTRFNRATDGVAKMLNMNLIHGRWFGPEDDGLEGVEPVVMNRKIAVAVFGREDAVGQTIWMEDRKGVVVGVVEDYRQYGEAHELVDYLFLRYTWDEMSEGEFFSTLSYRVKPGTPADFEAKVQEILQREAPDLTFAIHNWTDMRENRLKEPMIVMGSLVLVTVFLLLMVILGMLGVLWQNVTSRTQEIGLRRALGASETSIQRQIIIELLLLTFVGVGLGSFLALQLPLTGWFANLEMGQILRGIIGSALVITSLSALCAWYPGYMAMRVTPADSLRYE